MSIETMVTRAVLEDGFSPVLRKIAGEQDAYARKTNALNMLGNVAIGMGAGLIGFAAKSLKTAGELQGIRTALTAVEGAQKSAFDMAYIDKFAQKSMFTYMDLAHAGERLALAGVPVKDYLSDVADLAAASHKPLAQVAKLYDTLLAGGNVSLALSARGGFSQFYLSPAAIFAAAGKPYVPGKTKLVGSMTKEEAAAAVHKVLEQTHRAGLNETMAHTTLQGVEGMIADAMTRIGNNVVGNGDLTDTIKLLDTLAGDLNKVADAAGKIPHLGKDMVFGGLGLVAAGGILKGAAAFREWQSAANLAKIAGAAERAGEVAKVPIANAEAAAVTKSTGAFSGLRAMLLKVGTATMGESAATAAASRVMLSGIGTLGLYAVALAAIVAVGYEVVSMFNDMNKASREFEASSAAVIKAKGQGYDLKANAGQATGYNALPVWKQVGEEVVNGFANTDVFDTTDGGSSALTDAHSNALAKKHGMAPHGVRAQQIQAQKDQAAATAKAMHDAKVAENAATGAAANSYQLDPALEYKLSGDERRVALLEAQGASQKEINAAKQQEIRDLNTAADLLAKQAALATDVKKKYDLLNQSEDDRQKAKMLGLDKGGDKRDKLDKAVASIFGGGGLSGDDTMKRAGLTESFFAAMGKGKPAANPLKAALQQIAKRPIVLNLSLGDKPFAAIKSEIKDDTIGSLLRMLESSNLHGALGGH